LTQYAYQPSFSLPTTVAAQAALGTPVNAIGELQRGDLVFWDTHLNRLVNHVGIYVGNNIAIAANYTHGVEEFDLTLNYWQTRFMFGRRLPGIAVALSPFGTSTATIGYVVQAVNPQAPTVPVAGRIAIPLKMVSKAHARLRLQVAASLDFKLRAVHQY
jgi:hypothetical protein